MIYLLITLCLYIWLYIMMRKMKKHVLSTRFFLFVFWIVKVYIRGFGNWLIDLFIYCSWMYRWTYCYGKFIYTWLSDLFIIYNICIDYFLYAFTLLSDYEENGNGWQLVLFFFFLFVFGWCACVYILISDLLIN